MSETEREYRQMVKAMKKQEQATKTRQPKQARASSRLRHARPSAIVARHWAQFEQGDHPFPHDEE